MSRRRWKDLDRTPNPKSGAPAAPQVSPASGSPAAADEAWRVGQSLLRADPSAAARHFEQAREGVPPSPARGEQIAACYIAQAVAYLRAGALDAAQLSFSRLRGEALSPAAAEFARGLYELAQELREVDSATREEALEPLVHLVLNIRLPHPFRLFEQPEEEN